MTISRRSFLKTAGAAVAGGALVGCGEGGLLERDSQGMSSPLAAVTSTGPAWDRAGAIRRAVELAGGMEWLRPGDRVLIKPTHNSPEPFPFTASPAACAELVRMCFERGASRVVVADCLGVEHSLRSLEDPWGALWTGQLDATLRSFRSSGLWQAVHDVAAELGKTVAYRRRDQGEVVLTSFRDDGWSRFDTDGLTSGLPPRLASSWVHDQIERARQNEGETWDGEKAWWGFGDRKFDDAGWFSHERDRPGMWSPNLFDEVDHVVNLFRVSTHVFSHFTMAIKNWVGVMRPDDRLWMHQLNYIKNTYGTGDDPIRSEMAYHELLPELHLPHAAKERLFVADASEIVLSGGPDETDRAFFPAGLCLAATDMVGADVTGLAILRAGTLGPSGLAGVCAPQPQSPTQLVMEFVADLLPWRDGGGPMHGTDAKLCDPGFSSWDWVCIQRARELGLGAAGPDHLDLRFAVDGAHAVDSGWQSWITADTLRPPAR